MLMLIGGLVGGPVDGGSTCVVFGDRVFDDAGLGADPPGRQELGQDMMADGAAQIDVRAGEAAGGGTSSSRAALPGRRVIDERGQRVHSCVGLLLGNEVPGFRDDGAGHVLCPGADGGSHVGDRAVGA